MLSLPVPKDDTLKEIREFLLLPTIVDLVQESIQEVWNMIRKDEKKNCKNAFQIFHVKIRALFGLSNFNFAPCYVTCHTSSVLFYITSIV